jgi:16S rRNA (uracil1498-N3)-methyltransferase
VRNRFYVPAGLRVGETTDLTGDEFHHAVRVHRSRVGEEVELFDGRGSAFLGRIDAIGRDSATVAVLGSVPARDSKLSVDLGLALIQPERFELVLQKGTELGVRRFLPLITDRAEIKPERLTGKLDRLRKIILEATKQSGRATLPILEEPVPFHKALQSPGVHIMFDTDEEPTETPSRAEHLLLLIGPEGGWSEEELARARQAGAAFQRLGPRRLRAETAAIAAVTWAGIAFGDFTAHRTPHSAP